MTTWQFMWRLCTYRPGHFAVNVVLWGLFHSLPLTLGLITRAIFDNLSGSAPVGWNVWTLLAVLAVAALSRAGVFVFAFKAFSTYYLMVQALLRRNLMDYLLLATGSRIVPHSPAEAVTQFRDDVEDIADYVERWIDLGGFVLYGVSAVVLLFLIDPWITAVVCGPMLLMAAFIRRLGPLIRRYRRAFREATERVTGFIGESFSTVEAVKVAGKEVSMADRFTTLGEARRRAALRDTLLTELVRSVNTNLVNIGVGVVLIMAAAQMRAGQFTAGDLALYIHTLPRITGVLTFVGEVMTYHKRSRVAFDRLVHLLQDSPPANVVAHTPLHLDGDPPAPPHGVREHQPLEILEVRGLTYRYPGSRAGIKDISFTLRRGEFVVITGRMGAGKTTLLRALQGLVPAEGEILWNGRPVQDPATFFRPPHSSYTAQVPRLFSETLKQNVLLGESRDGQLGRALHLAVMEPDVMTLEKGIDTLVGTRGVKLSGGQVQRAAAARMFARGADLLIFDDLSSALDVQTEKRLWESLFADRQATCLVVSHRSVALQRADRIIVVENGGMVAEGTAAELTTDGEMGWMLEAAR